MAQKFYLFGFVCLLLLFYLTEIKKIFLAIIFENFVSADIATRGSESVKSKY